MIVCLTVMQDESERGGSSRRQPRLPPIAPKDDRASSTSSGRSTRPSATTVPPRTRLPPRSRTGCWTCRTRKVKCDEGRPICGQCARLSHPCDYNPRLSFRDDTSRVVERMQDVTVAGSIVWDRQCQAQVVRGYSNGAVGVASPATSSIGSAIDDLAPFATLLTDEERERKAEASPPGTFHVVVNPESFQHLGEYTLNDGDNRRTDIEERRRNSVALSLTSSLGRESSFEAIAVAGDPNIVILPRFEDLSRRATRDLKSPTSPISAAGSLQAIVKQEENDEAVPQRNADFTALRHFRDYVWKELVPPEHGNESSLRLLDEAALVFPPLVKAMMAVGSLSLVKRDGYERLDSLQYYSQAVPELQVTLRTDNDLASDGAFLTHFLLLVYEIAASDNDHTNIWSHHIKTLLRIALLRRQIFGAERFPYICWWTCNIDLEALLGGSGNGEFVGHMLNHDLIPPPSFHLFPLGGDGSSVVYPEETQSLSIVLQLDYEVTLHAIRMGLLAREFRSDDSFNSADLRSRTIMIKLRQSRISEIQDGLRQLWAVPAVQSLAQMQLPTRSSRLFHHAWTTYRACIIYSHTSMWPGQRADIPAGFETEIMAAAQQILQVAQAIVASQTSCSTFLVFPLFMAGYASMAGTQKLLAQELISKIEEKCLGRNIRATKVALDAIYERQNERFLLTGQSLDVDWLQVVAERGLSIVSFGL